VAEKKEMSRAAARAAKPEQRRTDRQQGAAGGSRWGCAEGSVVDSGDMKVHKVAAPCRVVFLPAAHGTHKPAHVKDSADSKMPAAARTNRRRTSRKRHAAVSPRTAPRPLRSAQAPCGVLSADGIDCEADIAAKLPRAYSQKDDPSRKGAMP